MYFYDTHRRHPSPEGVLFSRAACSLKGTAPYLIGKRPTRLIRSDASPPVNLVLHRDDALLRVEILVDVTLRIGEAGMACGRPHVPQAATCCRYLARANTAAIRRASPWWLKPTLSCPSWSRQRRAGSAGERPFAAPQAGGRDSTQRGHSPACHSITSSARARIDCGIGKPIARAALPLMMSSNFVGC